MARGNDFIMTIESDDEVDTSETKIEKKKDPNSKSLPDDATLNPDFNFDLSGDPYAELLLNTDGNDIVRQGTKPEPISVDSIIAKRKLLSKTLKRKRQTEQDEDLSSSSVDGASQAGSSRQSDAESDEESDPLATSDEDEDEDAGFTDDSESEDEDVVEDAGDDDDDSSEDSDEETQHEKDRKTAFFAPDSTATAKKHSSFLSMNLSRPILKSLTTLGFTQPTPIQAATIPVALLGKDIVGGAVTGSGKTAAFIIPMVERLLYRGKGKQAAATRCLILLPTRELAVQCYEVGVKLANHTDIQFSLIVGGLSVKVQEASLRNRPDVVIATPGRLIDHLRNSPSFNLDALDILVLDEADRMLSDGFADELTEIIRSCPVTRQTMLFSATMTDSVDELVKMSLNKPVRLFVDPKKSTAAGLVQEFVRVKAGREGDRSALLVGLCKRTFKTKTIIFLRSKKLAHQLRVVFSLVGLRAEELHGDLSQEQRLKSLQVFRDGNVDYLLATDLAARGLDIKGIETVINYDMPGQLAQYLHRVGRTARAGRKGRAVTLVGEADRKMLKAAIKHAAGDSIRHRIVPAESVSKWTGKLDALKSEVSDIMKEEIEEKQLRRAEMELKKGQNMIEHGDEIYSRPARSWFQSSHDKSKAEAVSKNEYQAGFEKGRSNQPAKASVADKPQRDKMSGLSRKVKRRKMMLEQDKELGDAGAIAAGIRAAKKGGKPQKIGIPDPRSSSKEGKKKKSSSSLRVTSKKHGAFDQEFGKSSSSRDPREGARAKKSDKIRGIDTKKKKGAGKRKSR